MSCRCARRRSTNALASIDKSSVGHASAAVMTMPIACLESSRPWSLVFPSAHNSNELDRVAICDGFSASSGGSLIDAGRVVETEEAEVAEDEVVEEVAEGPDKGRSVWLGGGKGTVLSGLDKAMISAGGVGKVRGGIVIAEAKLLCPTFGCSASVVASASAAPPLPPVSAFFATSPFSPPSLDASASFRTDTEGAPLSPSHSGAKCIAVLVSARFFSPPSPSLVNSLSAPPFAP